MSAKIKIKVRGKTIRKGGLMVWTGKVPPMRVEVAVRKMRDRLVK